VLGFSEAIRIWLLELARDHRNDLMLVLFRLSLVDGTSHNKRYKTQKWFRNLTRNRPAPLTKTHRLARFSLAIRIESVDNYNQRMR
jgi:hypothetical protein